MYELWNISIILVYLTQYTISNVYRNFNVLAAICDYKCNLNFHQNYIIVNSRLDVLSDLFDLALTFPH